MVNLRELYPSTAPAVATHKPSNPAIISIRQATIADAAALTDLGRRSFAETHRRAFATEADLESFLDTTWTLPSLESELADGMNLFLVAHIHGTLAGLIKLRPAPPPDAPETPHAAEISRFYLDYGRIGQGIGARLMEDALMAARRRGYQMCWLQMWAQNSRALAFYRRYGFEVTSLDDWSYGQSQVQVLVLARVHKAVGVRLV